MPGTALGVEDTAVGGQDWIAALMELTVHLAEADSKKQEKPKVMTRAMQRTDTGRWDAANSGVGAL